MKKTKSSNAPAASPSPEPVLAALRREDGPLGSLVELAVDALLDRPLAHLVDTGWVLRAIDAELSVGATSLVITRVLQPAAARERQRALERRERVGDWVSDGKIPEIMELLRRPFPVSPEIVEDLVDQGAVRSMLAAVVQEAIVGFVQRSKLPGLSGAADLVGALGRRAGKGLFGGVGRGIEKQLEHTVTEFLDQSMARLTGKVVEMAGSETSLRMMGKMRADLMQKALGTRVSFYYEELAKLPTEEIWALAPHLIAHNLARPELRQALLQEVEAVMELERERPVRELLEEMGVLEQVRDLSRELGLKNARSVVETPRFEQWMGDLLRGE